MSGGRKVVIITLECGNLKIGKRIFKEELKSCILVAVGRTVTRTLWLTLKQINSVKNKPGNCSELR
jgi:hypothetical protein